MNVPSCWETNGDSAFGAQLPVGASEPAPVRLATDDDQPAPLGQGAPEVRQPAVTARVEDHVVPVRAVREVLAGVIDDVIGAERADALSFAGLADPGHLTRAEAAAG